VGYIRLKSLDFPCEVIIKHLELGRSQLIELLSDILFGFLDKTLSVVINQEFLEKPAFLSCLHLLLSVSDAAVQRILSFGAASLESVLEILDGVGLYEHEVAGEFLCSFGGNIHSTLDINVQNANLSLRHDFSHGCLVCAIEVSVDLIVL
jgi:hypothetical protein